MQKIQFNISGFPIKIKTSPDVFTPSPHGTQALASVIKVDHEETVLDIGTGTGLLAILATKMGGIVSATDILEDAVSLAKENAALNKVIINFRKGNLFSSFRKEKYDVIIANIPQELLSPKIKKGWDANKITSYSGGDDGTDVLLKTLKQAPKHMHTNSRIYCVVYTMTNYRKTLDYIVKNFSTKLINFYSGPVKDFIYKDLTWYKSNHNIGMYEIGKKHFADIFTFELKLRPIQDSNQDQKRKM